MTLIIRHEMTLIIRHEMTLIIRHEMTLIIRHEMTLLQIEVILSQLLKDNPLSGRTLNVYTNQRWKIGK
jgi:hypothetical protein